MHTIEKQLRDLGFKDEAGVFVRYDNDDPVGHKYQCHIGGETYVVGAKTFRRGIIELNMYFNVRTPVADAIKLLTKHLAEVHSDFVRLYERNSWH